MHHIMQVYYSWKLFVRLWWKTLKSGFKSGLILEYKAELTVCESIYLLVYFSQNSSYSDCGILSMFYGAGLL